MKKWIFEIIKILWWLLVARLPVSIHQISATYAKQIGCPPAGDCYVPGSELLLPFDILVMGSALLLWPVCFWFLGGGWLIRKFLQYTKKSLTTASSGTPGTTRHVS